MTLKERTAAISLAASLILAVVKLVIGLAIGSLALITDALHSCTDFLATAVTWITVRMADRPADAEHPYGHGKFENVAALGEATLLLLLGGGVMVAAVGRIGAGAPPPPLSGIAIGVLLIEIVINAWRARALRRVGRETHSAALEADSLHFASDVFSSARANAMWNSGGRESEAWHPPGLSPCIQFAGDDAGRAALRNDARSAKKFRATRRAAVRKLLEKEGYLLPSALNCFR